MQLSQSLNIKQKQSLVMTPQLQQAIKLLQLTNLELKQYLEEQTFDNPFVNVEEEKSRAENKKTEEIPTKFEDSNSDQINLKDTADFSDDPTKNEDYDNRFDNANLEFGVSSKPSSGGNEDWDLISSIVPDHEKSLVAHIEEQLPYLLNTPREHFIAQYFLEAIEPSGWLGKSVEVLSAESGLEINELEAILQKLQKVEPTGLFARDLSECLRLQILEKDLLCKNFLFY